MSTRKSSFVFEDFFRGKPVSFFSLEEQSINSTDGGQKRLVTHLREVQLLTAKKEVQTGNSTPTEGASYRAVTGTVRPFQ